MRFAVLIAATSVAFSTITNAALDCDSQLSASGNHWNVTCGYQLQAGSEQLVEGDTELESCLEACVEGKNCYGVNFAPNGSCILASGEQQGARKVSSYTALVRVLEPEATTTSTSRVKITSTILGPGITRTTLDSITSTTSRASTLASTAPASDGLCSVPLDEVDQCPSCDGQLANVAGKYYRIACDQELTRPTNGTYALQEGVSPGGCMEECNALPFCQGISYTDYNCVVAKGPASATPHLRLTAFIPVAPPTATRSPSAYPTGTFTPRTTSAKAYTTSSAEPMFSILPVPPYCDQSAPTCPGCDGVEVEDKLNATYTMMCIEPVCNSTVPVSSANTRELCMEGCDQDVTCLAAIWFPKNTTCHLCQQGLEVAEDSRDNLDYIVLVAEEQGDDDEDTTSTFSSIEAFPTPFDSLASTRTASTTLRNRARPVITGYNPGGQIIDLTTAAVPLNPPRPIVTDTGVPVFNPTAASSPSGSPLPSSGFSSDASNYTVSYAPPRSGQPNPISGYNPGGPIMSVSSSSPTASTGIPHITNLPPVTCPFYDGDVFIDNDGDFFEIMCDGTYNAAHSRYISATDLPACIASCTGDCDGIQFGYTTRCGLYTSISSVISATGWTAAAKIDLPTSVAALSTSTPFPQGSVYPEGTGMITSLAASATLAPYTNATRH